MIFPNPNLLDVVRDILEEKLFGNGQHHLIHEARNQADALELLDSRRYDLIITHLHIPENRKSSVIEKEERGLALLQSLALGDAWTQIPGIVVTVKAEPRLYDAVSDLKDCYMVIEGSEDWHDRLMKCCKKALSPGHVQEEKKSGKLEIYLDLGHKQGYYTLKGIGVPYDDQGLIPINCDSMKDLARRSRNIGRVPKDMWRDELLSIGKTLVKEIFLNTPNLHSHFESMVDALGGGGENVKIRFIIEKEVHPIVLEALFMRDKHLMLYAPIYRTIKVEGGPWPYPLFQDEETQRGQINCLIIEADAWGRVPGVKNKNGEELELDKLKHVQEECESLDCYLRKNKNLFRIGRVEWIRQSPANKSFAEYVKEVLTSKDNKWHIVHFAGHSYYDSDDSEDTGYVFFPGRPDPEAVSIANFSIWLRSHRSTRLIYLSSCHSSEEGFIFQLARHSIPAIIGFRWEVGDDMAAKHSETFYQHLFEEKNLEYAFLKTRNQMYQDHKNDRIWAAPMLVLQMG